ncbi:serine/threonine-protein kinase [Streptosporangium sp. KLBMP 9127]|nr:PASTA domain-containing protein [Streptosporangium sp. KLBMP 9127]
MPHAQPLRTGDPGRLGGYELSGRLGEGGQGAVYLATRPDTDGERYAVKLLYAPVGADEAAFLREIEMAKQVARFCTAQVLDAGVADGRPYIVSEYVDGPTLQRDVALAGPRSGGALERLAIGTATALAAIHQAGIVHRDFKPQNVLLGPDGPRVIDFGLARALDAAATLSGRGAGTPAYMAPEQISAGDITAAADVFAWGSAICFAANGRPPFGHDSIAAVMHRILTARPVIGALTGQLGALVERCLAKDPALRPGSRELLLTLLGEPTPVPVPERSDSSGPAFYLSAPEAPAVQGEADPGTDLDADSFGDAASDPDADFFGHAGSDPDADPDAASEGKAGEVQAVPAGLGMAARVIPAGQAGEGRTGLSAGEPYSVAESVDGEARSLPEVRAGGEAHEVRAGWTTGLARAGSRGGGGRSGPEDEVTRTHPGRASRASMAVSGSLLVSAAVLVTVLVPALTGDDSGELRPGGVQVSGPTATATAAAPADSGPPDDEPSAPPRLAGSAPAPTPTAGTATVNVPALVGLDRAEAVRAIKRAGLAAGPIAEIDSAERIGRVLTVVPAAGSAVAAGTRIRLEVSAGVRVPALVGLQWPAAQSALTTAGLVVGEVTRACSGQSTGQVIESRPAAESRVAGGSAVALVVARQGVAVPGVVGQGQAEAEQAVRGAGLAVRVRPRIVESPAQVGVVLAQRPAPGGCAGPGRAVVIAVGVEGTGGPGPGESPDPSAEPTAP